MDGSHLRPQPKPHHFPHMSRSNGCLPFLRALTLFLVILLLYCHPHPRTRPKRCGNLKTGCNVIGPGIHELTFPAVHVQSTCMYPDLGSRFFLILKIIFNKNNLFRSLARKDTDSSQVDIKKNTSSVQIPVYTNNTILMFAMHTVVIVHSRTRAAANVTNLKVPGRKIKYTLIEDMIYILRILPTRSLGIKRNSDPCLRNTLPALCFVVTPMPSLVIIADVSYFTSNRT